MLQTTGPISLSDVGQEFQTQQPYKMSSFYGLYGLPSFGPIALSDFYGKTYYTLELFVPEKMFYVYYGKSLNISTSYILDGIYEVDNPSNSFNVVGVSDPVNGTIQFEDSYILFTSTGEVGSDTRFNVSISDESGYMSLLSFSINVIEEPISIPSEEGNCLLDEILGINEVLGIEPSLRCKILTE